MEKKYDDLQLGDWLKLKCLLIFAFIVYITNR